MGATDETAAEDRPLSRQETLPLGIVLELRRLDHPWKDHSWTPVAVIPGAPSRDPKGDWLLLKEGEGWARYHCGTLPLHLFRKETEDYKLNLAQSPPRLFVVLREGTDVAHELVPFVVTASPIEAQDYLDSGDDIVEPVPMPPEVVAFVHDFVERHHVDTPFHKRKRKRHDAAPGKTGEAPGSKASVPKGDRHG